MWGCGGGAGGGGVVFWGSGVMEGINKINVFLLFSLDYLVEVVFGESYGKL